ncbi:MAG: YeeE/YedE thiosulfate transporter family protein [Paracoccaceae bacterium]|nr:YeeE/YedE thiosulfate transporter family protein [Paracoccaceae bacterium]
MQTDWIMGLTGGLVIGLAASFYLLTNGKVMGASGIIGGLVDKSGWSTARDRIVFLAGLVFAPMVCSMVLDIQTTTNATTNAFVLVLAGLMVGIGTRLANGCTSGHGVCGISRLSLRGIFSTIFYIIAGIVTVLMFRHAWNII